MEIVLESHVPDLDRPIARELGVAVVGTARFPHSQGAGSIRLLLIHLGIIVWALLKRLGLDWRRLVQSPVARAFMDADVVADLSGDSYRDRPGGRALPHNIWMLSAIALGKPVVLVSQSLGPFKWHSKAVTRYCISRAKMAYVREPKTVDVLRTLGVKRDIVHLAPEIAFRLPAAPEGLLVPILSRAGLDPARMQNATMVGISTSSVMQRLSDKQKLGYMAKMIHIMRFIHAKYDALLMLVPHEVKPHLWGKDDVAVAQELYDEMGRPEWIAVVRQDLTPQELKGVIAKCDAFLGARMHASIAALSSGVPTILLSWAHKYKGLMEYIGLPEFVWNVTDDVEELEELFAKLWEGRGEIAKVLEQYNSQSKHLIRQEISSLVEIGRNHLAPAWCY